MNKVYAAIAAVIVWFTVILQFSISILAYTQNGNSVFGAVVHLLSFFTILSNMLAGLALTAAVSKPDLAFVNFFKRGSVINAIALYITIVGLVYNLVLRSLWHPEGLFKLANELLHSLNPVLFIVFCLFFVPKQKLTWLQGLNWLWFPLVYLGYTLARGAVYHVYPYPFMNVDKLGYSTVLVNSFFVTIAFVVFGVIFLLINNKLAATVKNI